MLHWQSALRVSLTSPKTLKVAEKTSENADKGQNMVGGLKEEP